MTKRFLNISTDATLGGNAPADDIVSSQKAIKEYADTKQAQLVSGTNIKTINNRSILGSGNISISGGGSVAIDDNTITENESGEIQTVATVNANTASGAVGALFDWCGTYDEWVDQDIATQHPEWICFITDDDDIAVKQQALDFGLVTDPTDDDPLDAGNIDDDGGDDSGGPVSDHNGGAAQ